MKLQFKVSKLANLFFLVSNFSEWHFSCRTDYNKAWIEKTEPLKTEEVEILSKFKKIIKKYGFELSRVFYTDTEKDIWNGLEKITTKSEFITIERALKVFEPKFEKIWKADNLNEWASLFKKALDQKEYKQLAEDVYHFLGNQNQERNIEIIVLSSPLHGEGMTAAGGANIGSDHITLELPELNKDSWEFEYSIGILIHEVAHILFRETNLEKTIKEIIGKKNLPKLINKNIQPRYSTLEIISELIIESMIPYGYLAQKHFNFKPSSISFSRSNLRVLGENLQNFRKNKMISGTRLKKLWVWQLYPLTAFYIETKRQVDKDYILEIVELIEK